MGQGQNKPTLKLPHSVHIAVVMKGKCAALNRKPQREGRRVLGLTKASHRDVSRPVVQRLQRAVNLVRAVLRDLFAEAECVVIAPHKRRRLVQSDDVQDCEQCESHFFHGVEFVGSDCKIYTARYLISNFLGF